MILTPATCIHQRIKIFNPAYTWKIIPYLATHVNILAQI
jgi:hypothetical protein